MTTPRPRSTSRPRGFVAIGPGFYVWEESQTLAFRQARDLTRPSAEPPRPTPAPRARRRRN